MQSAYATGEIISNYRLERLIGVGGFGEVWLAEHVDLSTQVAIKIPTLIEYVKQLRAEGRIQYDLEHPNIVKIIDLNTSNNPPYCVMEYVDGENLRQRLEREVIIPPTEALAIIRQTSMALHEAHSQGIVHRDMKPENVLLDTKGDVQVTDFGLGTVGDEVTRSILLSSSGTGPSDASSPPVLSSPERSLSSDSIIRSDSLGGEPNPAFAGTYDYMSPEQRTGQRVDARSDIYAQGVMLYEMLMGSRPTGNIEKTMHEKGVPDYLAEAILTSLDEYDYRFASAAEFLQALRMDHFLRIPGKRSLLGNDLDEFLSTFNLRLKTIDGGRFEMGYSFGDENERPPHEVDIAPFVIGIYAVTASEYCLFLNEKGDANGEFIRLTKQSTFEQVGGRFRAIQGGEKHPVNSVSWTGALAFCDWLSNLTGLEFSLPTEEQWEYAARSGDSRNTYPTGLHPPTPDDACFGKSWANPVNTLSPVDAFAPSPFGLYGMAGNVWEWCREPFHGDYDKTKQHLESEDQRSHSHTYYVVRGGCWNSPGNELRCSFRNVQAKGIRTATTGFRVCRRP